MMNASKRTRSGHLPLFGLPALWPYLRQHKGLLLRCIAIGAVISGIDSVYPLFNRYAINHFIGQKTLDTLPVFIGLMLGLILMQTLLNYINVTDCAKIELYTNRDLRNNAFHHLQTISMSYFNRNSVGYVFARVISDSGTIGEMAAWRVMEVIWRGTYIILSLIVMMLVNWKMGLILIILVPVAALIIALFQKKLTALNHLVREQNSILTSQINEGITGVKTIRSLGIEEKLTEEFYGATGQMRKLAVRTNHYSALFTAVVSCLSAVAFAAVLWRGGNLTVRSCMEVGTLSIFMSYALNILDPIQNVVNSIAGMIAIQTNVERYLDFMETTGEVQDSPEVIAKYGDAFHEKRENWEPLHGDVEFADVTFRYPDGEETVLEHFNLKVPAGTMVAIVGETGAGKSTLVNLVCRFFEPTQGRVLVDGRDIRDRSLGWLHSNLGYVLQTSHLFSGTVRDNLRYGNTDATDEQILACLEQIAPGFAADRLPKGLDTEVGEGGDFLSAGEKQLLSIARALLADPRILILDEATAAVDTLTEQKIQKAISMAIQDRTSFVIAHRLSTIVHADTIILVQDGRIVEQGSHRDLMQQKGAYYRLYTRQYEEQTVDMTRS